MQMQYLDTYYTIYYRWYVYMYAAWNMNLHSSLHTEKFWVNSRLRAEVTQLQGRELTLPQRGKKKSKFHINSQTCHHKQKRGRLSMEALLELSDPTEL